MSTTDGSGRSRRQKRIPGSDRRVDDEFDETGMRALLSDLTQPTAQNDELTARLKRSLAVTARDATDQRAIPPRDAVVLHRQSFSMPALMTLIGGTAAAGLIGLFALDLLGSTRMDADDALATTTLSGAGVPVTSSGTQYRRETLPQQVSALVSAAPSADHAISGTLTGENAARARRTGLASPTPNAALSIGDTGNPRATVATASANEPIERDVLACLRHLRMPLSTVDLVDIATLDHKPVAVVISSEGGNRIVRAIDTACPLFGEAVLAGPSVLPS